MSMSMHMPVTIGVPLFLLLVMSVAVVVMQPLGGHTQQGAVQLQAREHQKKGIGRRGSRQDDTEAHVSPRKARRNAHHKEMGAVGGTV